MSADIKVYPNPTTGKLTIDNIELFDMAGKKLDLPLQTAIDISHLPNGIYFLKINHQTVKIVKGSF